MDSRTLGLAVLHANVDGLGAEAISAASDTCKVRRQQLQTFVQAITNHVRNDFVDLVIL